MAVTMKGYFPAGSAFTLKGPSTLTTNDILKPVVQDKSAANTIKLGSDGEVMVGLIEQIENRETQAEGMLVTVRFNFGAEVAYSGTLNVGDAVVCNGSGGVRAYASSTDTVAAGEVLPKVWEITDSTNHYCVIKK